MKTIAAAILAGGAIMASQAGFAQGGPTFVSNDLYLGFQNQAGGGTQDYIINLGQASSIIGNSVNLSSDFNVSDFNAVFGNSTSMYGGVVGGLQNFLSADMYLTQLRNGGAGNPLMPGSSMNTFTRGEINSAVATLSQVNMPAVVGTGILDNTKSWETYVEPTLTHSTFYGASGFNPDSPVSHSTVLYEDLWSVANNTFGPSPFIYDGYFTLDVTGSNASLTFTAVPESSRYGLIGAGSLLLFAFARRSIGKTA